MEICFNCSAVSVYCFFINWLKWGNSVWNPFIFESQHHPKLLSIFAFLESPISPLQLFMADPKVSFLSLPLLCIGLLALFTLHIKYQFTAIFSTVIVLVFSLTVTKVGHVQFFLTVIMVIAFWVYFEYTSLKQYQFRFYSLWLYLLWIAFCCLLYFMTNDLSKHYVISSFLRDTIGLPTFIIEVILMYALISFGIKRSKDCNTSLCKN